MAGGSICAIYRNIPPYKVIVVCFHSILWLGPEKYKLQKSRLWLGGFNRDGLMETE